MWSIKFFFFFFHSVHRPVPGSARQAPSHAPLHLRHRKQPGGPPLPRHTLPLQQPAGHLRHDGRWAGCLTSERPINSHLRYIALYIKNNDNFYISDSWWLIIVIETNCQAASRRRSSGGKARRYTTIVSYECELMFSKGSRGCTSHVSYTIMCVSAIWLATGLSAL